MKLEINLAKNIGFCSGVNRAIKIAKEASAKFGEVAMLGDIVHNEIVIKDLNESGVKVYSKLEEIPKNIPIIFRSHGTPKEVWEKANALNLKIIDATCPLVKRIHKEAKRLEAEKRKIVIIGDHHHEEVEALVSEIKDPIVISNVEEAEKIDFYPKLGVVVQSTQDIAKVQEIIKVLCSKSEDLHFINTICASTRERQEQIKSLAIENDVMLIIGSPKSANTRRLLEISRRINPKSYLVNGPSDVSAEILEGARKVGIATGASTPLSVVESVMEKINEIGENKLN